MVFEFAVGGAAEFCDDLGGRLAFEMGWRVWGRGVWRKRAGETPQGSC